jgi:putative transposase
MSKISYSGYRFPPEIIHQAIWLFLQFTLSLRDVEDLGQPFRTDDRG